MTRSMVTQTGGSQCPLLPCNTSSTVSTPPSPLVYPREEGLNGGAGLFLLMIVVYLKALPDLAAKYP